MITSILVAAWDKVPWYVKWTFVLLLLPIQLKEWSTSFVRSEVHAVINPLKEQRDIQFKARNDIIDVELKHQNEKLDNITKDLRDIKVYLMGSKQ